MAGTEWLRDLADAIDATEPTARQPEVAVSMSADDLPHGPYQVMVQLLHFGSEGLSRPVQLIIAQSNAESLRQQLDNALDALHHRQWSDAVCGPCATCNSTRMVHPIRHGSPSAEHCPVCQPKLVAARTQLTIGTPQANHG